VGANEDDLRRAMANAELIPGGFRVALFDYTGDLKQLCEGTGIPHYSTEAQPCFLCHCPNLARVRTLTVLFDRWARKVVRSLRKTFTPRRPPQGSAITGPTWGRAWARSARSS